MRRMILSVVVLVLVVSSAQALPISFQSYHVQTIGIGDSLNDVFKALGPPHAIQMLGSDNEGGAIQLLYFRKEDSFSIGVSDLPENKVVQMEISGSGWTTDAPVKVGDNVDGVISKMGKPDKIDDISTQKVWMLEQAGNDAVMRQLIEKSSGDTALWYQQRGLYAEYDKSQKLVKSVKIYDPFSKLSVNVSKS